MIAMYSALMNTKLSNDRSFYHVYVSARLLFMTTAQVANVMILIINGSVRQILEIHSKCAQKYYNY